MKERFHLRLFFISDLVVVGIVAKGAKVLAVGAAEVVESVFVQRDRRKEHVFAWRMKLKKEGREPKSGEKLVSLPKQQNPRLESASEEVIMDDVVDPVLRRVTLETT